MFDYLVQEAVKTLRTELEGYKQASQISQQHISQLEAKNASLQKLISEHVDNSKQETAEPLLPPPPNADTKTQLQNLALSGKFSKVTYVPLFTAFLVGKEGGYLLRHKNNTRKAFAHLPTVASKSITLKQHSNLTPPLDANIVKDEWEWLQHRIDSRLDEKMVL